MNFLGWISHYHYEQSINRHLSGVPAVEAIFVSVEDEVTHVYSVVHDFHSELYDRLLNQEEKIEQEWPFVKFEFHVRARQDRRVLQTAPFGAHPIFVR